MLTKWRDMKGCRKRDLQSIVGFSEPHLHSSEGRQVIQAKVARPNSNSSERR